MEISKSDDTDINGFFTSIEEAAMPSKSEITLPSGHELEDGVTYYWHVYAANNWIGYWSGMWHFTINKNGNTPPNTPSNPSPIDGATNVSRTANLDWSCSDPDGDTVYYTVWLSKGNNTFSDYERIKIDATGSNADPGTMDPDAHYYWKVQADDHKGGVTSVENWDFYTETQNHPPNTPSTPSPSDGATNVSRTANLDWSCSDPDGDTVYYTVWLSKGNNTFSDYERIKIDSTGSNADPGTMEKGEHYFWKVQADDHNGGISTVDHWDFYTETQNHPPNTPSSPTPSDAATNVSCTANLDWSCSDPDGDTVYYTVWLSKGNNTFSDYERIKIDATGSDADPGTMEKDEHYYWKVKADDHNGGVKTVDSWDFYTASSIDYLIELKDDVFLNGSKRTSIDLAPGSNVNGRLDYTLYNPSWHTSAVHKVVIGLRDGSGNWVGGEPLMIDSTTASSNGSFRNDKAFGDITVPSTGGTYYLWAKSVLTTSNSVAITEFKNVKTTTDQKLEKKIASVIVGVNLPFLGILTKYGDVWGANCQGVSPFQNPTRRGWPGFTFDPVNRHYVLTGDVNGDDTLDLIQVTPYTDVWVALNNGYYIQPPSRWGWPGFRYDERGGYDGFLPLSGDFNGDGKCDLAQVTPDRHIHVSLSDGTKFKNPGDWGAVYNWENWFRFSCFSRATHNLTGMISLAGDVNGDGKCDIIEISSSGEACVALSNGYQFITPPACWGYLGFSYTPYDGFYPLCDDVTGDGRADLIQITPHKDVYVAPSNGSGFNPPDPWGSLNFHYYEYAGYYPLTGDVNADGRADLIQITPHGEAWVAISGGWYFDNPESWGKLGFLFSRDNHYLPFYLGY